MPKAKKHKIFRDSDDSDIEQDVDNDLLIDKSSGDEDENDKHKGSDDDGSSDDDGENSDDGAPEAVKFTDSKKNVLDRVRSAIKQIERDNEQLKATRRKKHAMFAQQKKQKQKQQNFTALPADILEAIQSDRLTAPSGRKSTVGAVDKATSAKRLVDVGSSASTSESSAVKPARLSESEDFIPLETSDNVIRAISVDRSTAIASLTARRAAQFKHQQLYGPRVRRQPVAKFLSNSVKRKAMSSS